MAHYTWNNLTLCYLWVTCGKLVVVNTCRHLTLSFLPSFWLCDCVEVADTGGDDVPGVSTQSTPSLLLLIPTSLSGWMIAACFPVLVNLIVFTIQSERLSYSSLPVPVIILPVSVGVIVWPVRSCETVSYLLPVFPVAKCDMTVVTAKCDTTVITTNTWHPISHRTACWVFLV